MSGTPRRPRSMMWLALAIFAVIVILAAAGCARQPTRSILFAGGTADGKSTAIIVTVDIVFSSGTTSTLKYPQEYVVPQPPFTHLHEAEVGTIIHMSITVVPTERGQKVTCSILIDGRSVDTGTGTYPKGVVCLGPPI